MPETVALCAIAKNEGRYLLEWVNFHRDVGFDRVFVYDNDSTDGGGASLGEMDRVTVKSWPTVDGVAPQEPAYNDFLNEEGAGYDWIAFFDIDEFLNLKRHDNVQAFLSQFPEAGGVAVNWRMFGSGGSEHYEARPVLDRFPTASQSSFPPNAHVKCIIRPRAVKASAVHSPYFKEGERLVDACSRPLSSETHNVLQYEIDHSVAQLNHYFVKSRGEFQEKRLRGRADIEQGNEAKFRAAEEFDMYDRNDDLELSILRLRRTPATAVRRD